MRILTFGDSVTRGERDGVLPHETYSAVLEADLRARGFDVEVIRSGVGGETTEGALARLHSALQPKPDYMTIMYGCNDAAVEEGEMEPRLPIDKYRQNLLALLGQVRVAGIKPVLMTPVPMAPFGITLTHYASRSPYLEHGINFVLARYIDTVRLIAEKTATPLIDINAAFFDLAGSEANMEHLYTDGMHPNPAGHRIIADKMVDFFVTQH